MIFTRKCGNRVEHDGHLGVPDHWGPFCSIGCLNVWPLLSERSIASQCFVQLKDCESYDDGRQRLLKRKI